MRQTNQRHFEREGEPHRGPILQPTLNLLNVRKTCIATAQHDRARIEVSKLTQNPSNAMGELPPSFFEIPLGVLPSIGEESRARELVWVASKEARPRPSQPLKFHRHDTIYFLDKRTTNAAAESEAYRG